MELAPFAWQAVPHPSDAAFMMHSISYFNSNKEVHGVVVAVPTTYTEVYDDLREIKDEAASRE